MRALKTIREVVHAYEKAARLYDLMNLLYFFGRDKRFASMLVEKLTPDVNDTALNLCCGTGLDFPFLLKKTKNKVMLRGIDVSFEMLQQVRKKVRSVNALNLITSDAAHLPLRDRTCSAILVSFCLKVTPTYKKAIKEMARVLKPN